MEKILTITAIIIMSLIVTSCSNNQIVEVDNKSTSYQIKNLEATILFGDSDIQNSYNLYKNATIWKDKMWSVMDYEIFAIDLKTNTTELVDRLKLIPEFQGDYEKTYASENNLWIFGYNHPANTKYTATGLARYNIDSGKLEEYDFPELRDININEICEVGDKLYIYAGLELFELDYKNKKIEKVNIHIEPYHIEKIKNKLWVATYENGIYVLEENGEFTHLTKNNKLQSNEIGTLISDKNFAVITYAGRFFTKYNYKNDEWKNYDLENLERVYLYYDQQSDIWIFHDNSLQKVESEQNISEWYTINLSKDKNDDNYVEFLNDILVSDGYMYIGTNKGIIYINITTKEVRRVMKDKDVYKLLKYDNKVFAINDYGIYELVESHR